MVVGRNAWPPFLLVRGGLLRSLAPRPSAVIPAGKIAPDGKIARVRICRVEDAPDKEIRDPEGIRGNTAGWVPASNANFCNAKVANGLTVDRGQIKLKCGLAGAAWSRPLC